ncbi:MAG: type II toxin-antitoxin system HigA family antitoxin [Gammaproteobacteria bacterium]
MHIRPIRTQADHDAALKRIAQLMSAKRDTPEGDELDVLTTLVEAYEKRHFPIEAADPVEAINFRIEQLGLERKDLVPYLGSRHRVSEILNRRRGLSLEMIRRLHDGLRIPLEVLICRK